MIVELFGPPGSGKTTFAHALTVRLRACELNAELKLSWRPTERTFVFGVDSKAGSQQTNAVLHRVARPIREMLTIACHPLANSRDVRMAMRLIRLLPPKNVTLLLKNVQYISRLTHSWHSKSDGSDVTIFDQAFVQAVCSLARMAGVADEGVIAEALSYLPKSDLFVCVEVPLEVVKARLQDRQLLQSRLERLLEADLIDQLASRELIGRLQAILVKEGRRLVTVSSLDQESLERSIEIVKDEIIDKFRLERRGAA